MDKNETHKEYEVSFLAKEEGGAAEMMRLLGQHGAEITLEGPVEKIALAYKINKESSAYFGYFHVSAEPAEMKSLEHDLVTNAHIMRSLILTPPSLKTKPRPMGRPSRPSSALTDESVAPVAEKKMGEPLPLSNEALTKKIEEILQQ